MKELLMEIWRTISAILMGICILGVMVSPIVLALSTMNFWFLIGLIPSISTGIVLFGKMDSY